ncbi:MAG: endonuclease VII domain-containing protein [Actinomycetota bacterium]
MVRHVLEQTTPYEPSLLSCRDCQRWLPRDAFPRHRSRPTGRGAYCKDCHNRRVRESVAKNGGARRYHLRRKYGIEPTEFDRLLASQSGLCAVCGLPNPTQVDHDHRTGAVRGILCLSCNAAVGAFGERADIILKAIEYLERQQ